jgi:hypothetical protein
MTTYPCESCGKPRGIGSWPICDLDGSGKHGHGAPHGANRISAIHKSERTVIYSNPRTGEVRYPPRADVAMHPKYAAQGYVRQELESARDVAAFEKKTGRVHERSWFDPGSGGAERSLGIGIEEPKIKGLDHAYSDSQLLTAADMAG